MRTPITLKIKFKSSSLDQFIERYSVDVSRGGIFIRTKEPLAVGTTLRFEFQLQDGSSLIGGEGTVVWNRAYDPSRSGVAPGMGVRFDKLTADSQRVLERILSEKHKRGEAQLESRFDAGVRASREAKAQDFNDQGTPLPPAAPGLSGTFGDEPTRMMAADQVSQLAEAMQREDSFAQEQPTRRATMEEIQKAVAGQASAQDHPGAGRTGRTSEHVRLGSGVASPAAPRAMNLPRGSGRVTSMGMVSPHLAAGTAPSAETPAGPRASDDEALPPSLSTRPVTAEQAAALIALSTSAHTPPRSPETPIITQAEEAPGSAASARGGAAQAAPPDDSHEPATIPVIAVSPVLSVPRPSALSAPLFPDAATHQGAADEPGENQPITTTLVGVGAPSPLVPPPEAPPSTRSRPAASSTSARPAPTPAPSARSERDRPAEQPPAPTATPAAEPAGASNLSLTIPGVPGIDVELPQESPATPLDPQAFAPPPPAKTPEPPAAPPPPIQEMVALPTQPEPGTRTPWLLIILALAVIVTGTIVYALYSARKGGEPQAPPPPVTRPTPPARPEDPAKAAAAPGQARPEAASAGGDKADKPGPEAAAKPEPPRAGEAPDQETADKADKGAGQAEDGISVAVTSEPAGAKVELAGQPAGVTPTQLKGLAVGKSYDLHLSLRGYQDLKMKVKAAANMKPLALKLTAYERVVEVISTPKNAEVFLDGKKVGRTPYALRKLDLSKVHQVEIRKTGYAAQTRNISETQDFAVKNGKEVLRLEVTLEASPDSKADARPDSKADARPDSKADKAPAPKKAEPAKKPAAEAPADAPAKAADKPADKPAKPEADGEKAGKGDEAAEAK